MASYITMKEAFDQSAEEIRVFHHLHGFPRHLTHHTGRDVPRVMSLDPTLHDYNDQGNWTGSVLMYALLFEYDLINIFDQTGERASVYSYWGSEFQKSGKGPDNDRTNLLEAILGCMGIQHGAKTQFAWNLVRRYALRHDLPREQFLRKALYDTSTDMYSEDDAIAEDIMNHFNRAWDIEICVKLTSLFHYVREHSVTPDYAAISAIAGCSHNNSELKQLYWNASDRFRLCHLPCDRNLPRQRRWGRTHLPRDQLLQTAVQDPSTDDDRIARDIMNYFSIAWDVEMCVKLTRLFNYVREHSATPDYAAICFMTGCSRKNGTLKQLYWNASDRFRLVYSAD